jgi:hypothetical protein
MDMALNIVRILQIHYYEYYQIQLPLILTHLRFSSVSRRKADTLLDHAHALEIAF